MKLKYKHGIAEIDSSSYYCPYVPLTTAGVVVSPRRESWKRELEILNTRINGYRHSQDSIMHANGVMHSKFPGEYIVEEYYDDVHKTFRLRLSFNSPEEESIWLIKYSS